MFKRYYKKLYQHSVSLGFNSIFKGLVNKETIKRIICPMDVSRYYELSAVMSEMKLKEKTKVLDISSPKLITSYLSSVNDKVKFWGIDKFKEEIKSWSDIVGDRKNLTLEYGDAVKLKYPNNFFDEVFSISVIEHVGNGKDNKDTEMMKEVYRVLKKGGKFYLTTIVSSKPNTIYKKGNLYYANSKKVSDTFFCRIYSYDQIKERLLNSTKFIVKKEMICNYRFPVFESTVNSLMPFSALFGFLNYILAPIFIRTQSIKKQIPKRAEYFTILEK